MKGTPNVFRARHTKSGTLQYVVGEYRDGTYYVALGVRDQKRSGCSTEFGSFSYVRKYSSLASARNCALGRYGYSMVADAYGNIGDVYERI